MAIRHKALRTAILGIIMLICAGATEAHALSMESVLVEEQSAALSNSVQFLEIGMATGMNAVWFEPSQEIDDFPSFIEMNAGIDYLLHQDLYEDGSPPAEEELPAGVAYTSVVTLTMGAMPEDSEGETHDEILFLIMGVSNDQAATPPHPIYTTAQIAFVMDHPGDTPFETATYNPRSEGTFYYYLGFVLSEGESVTFRYDVTEQADGGTPVFFTKATYDYQLVPESGTALLMGLGLAGLALCGRAGAGAGERRP
jgi:hypothetical protein